MRRIAGGIAGWLAAVVPLLGVNIAGYANVLDSETAVLAGAIALFGGIVLGGLVTGLLAGRATATREGGATRTLLSGVMAAILYVVSLIGVVTVATHVDAAPAVVVEHPLRIAGAIICLGAMLLGLSLLFGMLVGGRTSRPAQQPVPAAGMPQYRQDRQDMYLPQGAQNAPSGARPPAHGYYPDEHTQSGAQREYYDMPRRERARPYDDANRYAVHESHSAHDARGGYSDRERRYNDYEGRESHQQWQPAPQRSGAPSHPPTRHAPGRTASQRDGDWRDTWQEPRR